MQAHSSLRRDAVRPVWRWAVKGMLLGLVVAFLAFAPGTWWAALLHRASSGKVQFIEVRGTVWTGSARLLLTGGAGSRDNAVLPGRVDWQLRPGWLVLKTRINADCCLTTPLQGRLAPRWGGASLQITDGVLQLPATVLAGLGAPWNTAQLEGNLRLITQKFSVQWFGRRMTFAGRAELTALAVSSRLSAVKPLGSYRLTLTDGHPATLLLATLEGPLQLSGGWVKSRLRFEGVASAAAENEAELGQLLSLIGRREGARSIITFD